MKACAAPTPKKKTKKQHEKTALRVLASAGGIGGAGGGGGGCGVGKKAVCGLPTRGAYTSRAYDRVWRATGNRARAKAAYKKAAAAWDNGARE